MEERLAVQNQDVQVLLADNQRLTATHIALKQETTSLTARVAMNKALCGFLDGQGGYSDEGDVQQVLELREVEAIRASLHKVHANSERRVHTTGHIGNLCRGWLWSQDMIIMSLAIM